MARTAVQPGKFVSSQGRQGANLRVVFAAVVGAMVLAGLPFISREACLAALLLSAPVVADAQVVTENLTSRVAGAPPRAECAHYAR